jgi:hypothetical protein
VPLDKERPTTNFAAELVDQPYDIHNFAWQTWSWQATRWKLGTIN